MTAYLLDTNLLLRISDGNSATHLPSIEAIEWLLAQEHQLYVTGQNFIEFWAVVTRPLDVNGLGWTTQQTETMITQILNRFRFLNDTPEIFANWRSLVTTYNIKGKKTHDARLVAVMLTYGVTHLLTFNIDDFSSYPSITLMHPSNAK